jgi:hypothetical protein
MPMKVSGSTGTLVLCAMVAVHPSLCRHLARQPGQPSVHALSCRRWTNCESCILTAWPDELAGSSLEFSFDTQSGQCAPFLPAALVCGAACTECRLSCCQFGRRSLSLLRANMNSSDSALFRAAMLPAQFPTFREVGCADV